MIRTLRIMSIASVITAVCGVVFVLIFGFKPNSQIQAFLSKPFIVEQLKKEIGTAPQKEDKVSPLEVQAKAFALRINPPPPPPPPPPPVEKTPKQPPPPVQVATQVIVPPIVPPKFDLAGTAFYKENPEKSMALLNLVSEGYKWYRQGETVGRLTIHEVKEGSIVLYQNGTKNTELFVPATPSPIKSLLKSDQLALVSRGPSSTTSTPALVVIPPKTKTPTVDDGTGGKGAAVTTKIGTTASPMLRPVVQKNSPGAVRIPSTPPVVTAKPEPEKTPEEQKKELDKSIEGIKGIMNSPAEGVSEADRQKDMETWKQLIVLLQNEKENLEKNADNKSQNSAKTEDPNKK